MFGVLFLILMALMSFLALTFLRKVWGKDGIYVIAIGCICAANFYNVGSYGIEFYNTIIGVDSILYQCFIYCIIIMHLDYGKKISNSLLYSSIIAIIFAATVDFIAKWATIGLNTDIVWGFVSYLVSALATWVAVFVMFKIIDKCQQKNWNKYLVILLGVIITSFLNTAIYFGIMALIPNGLGTNFVPALLGSYVGKSIALVFTLLTAFLHNYLFNKKQEFISN